MKNTRRIFAFVTAIIMLASLGTMSALAHEKGSVDANLLDESLFVGQGQAENISIEDSAVALLQESPSAERQQGILDKAAYIGADLNDVAARSGLASNRQVLLAQNKYVDLPSRGSGVAFPGWFLWPTTIKQETSTWCSAATVQTALKYILGSSGFTVTQTSIMNSVGAGPGLQTVVTYMNNKLSQQGYSYPYLIETFGGNQATFDVCLLWDIQNYQPMVFTLANKSSGTGNLTKWPYYTNGHFTVCNGTADGATYSFSDPYYFKSYVASATADNGKLDKVWTYVADVSKQLHGQGNEKFAW